MGALSQTPTWNWWYFGVTREGRRRGHSNKGKRECALSLVCWVEWWSRVVGIPRRLYLTCNGLCSLARVAFTSITVSQWWVLFAAEGEDKCGFRQWITTRDWYFMTVGDANVSIKKPFRYFVVLGYNRVPSGMQWIKNEVLIGVELRKARKLGIKGSIGKYNAHS